MNEARRGPIGIYCSLCDRPIMADDRTRWHVNSTLVHAWCAHRAGPDTEPEPKIAKGEQ